MKTKTLIATTIAATFAVFVGASQAQAAVDMHRLYNKNTGEHFYTANVNEKNNLVKQGWLYENIGWTAPDQGEPVYRLYNKNSGDHHYTKDVAERSFLIRNGWSDENIGWYSSTNKEIPLYRAYNPNAKTGSHNYTTNKTEQNWLVNTVGWKDEGIGWYGVNPDSKPTTPPIEPEKPVNPPTEPEKPVDPEKPIDPPTEPEKPTVADVEEITDAVTPILNKVNAYRQANGLKPFKLDAGLSEATKIRTHDMKITGLTQDHIRPDGSSFATAYTADDFQRLYEVNTNAYAYNSDLLTAEKLAQQFLTQFQNSPTHNDILLNDPYTTDEQYIGITVTRFNMNPYQSVYYTSWIVGHN